MEPNNIEKQIKEKLSVGEIQPSAQAWDRLDAMLTVAENKKQKKSFPWLKLVAGFVLFAGVGYFILNQNTTTSNEILNSNTVVETIDEKEVLKNETIYKEDSLVDELDKKSEVLVDSKKVISESKKVNEILKRDDSKLKNQKPEIQQMINNSTVAVSNKSNSIITETERMSNKTEVPELSQNNQAIVLVEKAPIVKPKLKVDPNALLNQVEEEVDLNFRQKVFKKISKNFQEAKESFVSRNQE